MSKIEIDLSIADEISVVNITKDEEREVYFDAEVDWTGTYELRVYNSRVKNDAVRIDAITIDGTRLTWSLKPTEQGINDGKSYCEIYHIEEKTVIFKIDLTIDK